MQEADEAAATLDTNQSGGWSADAESEVDDSVRTWLSDWSSPPSRPASLAPSRPASLAPGQLQEQERNSALGSWGLNLGAVQSPEPWSASKMSARSAQMSARSAMSTTSIDSWKDTLLGTNPLVFNPFWNSQASTPPGICRQYFIADPLYPRV